MKTFKQFFAEMNDNPDPANIRLKYMELKKKEELNTLDAMEREKLKALEQHPAITGRK